MDVMADAIALARQCVEKIRVDGGGTFLNDIASSANGLRESLMSDYSTGGSAHRAFSGASTALEKMAHDYERTDGNQAQHYDSIMDIPAAQAPEYMGGKPGIYAADFAFVTQVEDAFEGYNSLDEFTQGVEYIVGLDWISSWLTTAGIVDPFSGFRDAMAGDWKDLGLVMGAMGNLVTFWEKAKADIDSVPARFDGNWIDSPDGYDFYQRNSEYGGNPNWSGNARDGYVAWLSKISEKSSDHGYMIELKCNELSSRLVAMYHGMDLILDAVQDLIELMPWGQSFDDFIKDLFLPWRIADKLVKIAGAAAKTLTRVRALIVLVIEAVGLFEGLLYAIGDLDFPDVDYNAPAVGG